MRTRLRLKLLLLAGWQYEVKDGEALIVDTNADARGAVLEKDGLGGHVD